MQGASTIPNFSDAETSWQELFVRLVFVLHLG
jgi:hypothetical protein